MKLNTLLLASAATMVVSSAFAADLPSKKAAPSSGSVQVCKVGGMTGMTLPGSDTCFGLSGYVRANFSYDMNSETEDQNLDWNTWGGSYRVQADFRSNTEVGVVRGVGRLTDGGMDKAYIQFAGLTAGMKDSIADIFGTNSIAFGAWTQGASGIDYKVSAGGLTFGIAAETPVNNNSSAEDVGDRPDLIAHISGKVGMIDFAVAAVSHQAQDWYENVDGHALLGRVGVSMNNVSVYAFGATAEDAGGYIGNTRAMPSGGFKFADGDADGLSSSLMGLGATFTQGAITVGAEYAAYNHEQNDGGGATEIDVEDIAVWASYRVAKNLSVTGEYYQSRIDANGWVPGDTDDVDSFYLRIQRDF